MLLRRTLRVCRMPSRTKVDQGIVDPPLDIPLGKSDMNMKSRVSFLSQDMTDDERTGIRGMSSNGFRMFDFSFLYGPIVVFPNIALSWRVAEPEDITPDSLKLFFMLQPKLDILVLGVGSPKNLDKVKKSVVQEIKKHKIGLEILPTEEAAPTFNWLNSEYRSVAGCFYPDKDLKVSHGESVRSMSMLNKNYDKLMNPPHQMFTHPADDYTVVDIALQDLFGMTKEKLDARKLVDEIRQEDLKQKIELAKEQRLHLEESRTVQQIDRKRDEDLKRLRDKADECEKLKGE